MFLWRSFVFQILISTSISRDLRKDWSTDVGSFECLSILCKDKHSHDTPSRLNNGIFDSEITHMDMHFKKLNTIPTESLAQHGQSLQILDFSNNEIQAIKVGDFPWLPNVHTLLLDYNEIEMIERKALDNLTNLHTLSLVENRLKHLPSFSRPTNLVKLDASFNQILEISRADVKLHSSIEELYLQKNKIEKLHKGVFRSNVNLHMLDLSHNPLTRLEPGWLTGPRKIYKLNLKQTKLNEIPSTDVAIIRHLDIRDVKTLWSIPNVKLFKSLERIEVTYSVHCCAFRKVDRESLPLPRAVMGCIDNSEKTTRKTLVPTMTVNSFPVSPTLAGSQTTSKPPTTYGSKVHHVDTYPGFLDIEKYFGKGNRNIPTTTTEINPNSQSSSVDAVDHFQSIIDSFKSNSTSPPLCSSKSNVTFVFQPHIGKHITCSPTPDAFNPCDDVMGSMFLRIFCWFVALLAVIGNFCQVIVIYTNTAEMSVYKLLMYHLAIANFIMGLYLLILCCLDTYTYGQYHNFVQSWQFSGGCKIAGFFAIFSAELSISILLIVTIERYLLIVHALRAHWQMRLIHAKIAIAFAWSYAFIVASLPLTDNISSYNKVAICLPFEVGTSSSKAYVLWLLTFNAVTFVYISAAYTRMYMSVNDGQPCAGVNTDIQVAKRMSLIMFSNLGSWIPISIAGYITLFSRISVNIEVSKILLVFGFPLNAWTNPFLYAFFTRIFQEDVLYILSKLKICSGKNDNRQRGRVPYGRNRNGSRASDTTNASTLNGQNSLQRMANVPNYRVAHKREQSPLQKMFESEDQQTKILLEKTDYLCPLNTDPKFFEETQEAEICYEARDRLRSDSGGSSLDQDVSFKQTFEKYGRARSISEALSPNDDPSLQVVCLNRDHLSPVTGITNI